MTFDDVTFDDLDPSYRDLMTVKIELANLLWFRDRVNSYVVPGDCDTRDSVYELVKDLRKEVEDLKAQLKQAQEARDAALDLASFVGEQV